MRKLRRTLCAAFVSATPLLLVGSQRTRALVTQEAGGRTMKTVAYLLMAVSLLGATPVLADWYDTSKRPDLWTR
jgi:hypothetical protein